MIWRLVSHGRSGILRAMSTAATDDGTIALLRPIVRVKPDEALRLAVSSAWIFLALTAYYCRKGQDELCFVHRTTLTVPLQVRTDAPSATEPVLFYQLPPDGGS